MDLKSLRRNIDQIDNSILRLLQRRMEQAAIIRKFKEVDDDKQREEEILNNLINRVGPLIEKDFVTHIYKQIIQETRRIEEKTGKLIAFQGEHGAYSEMACVGWNDKLSPIPCLEFSDVFEGVENGVYEYGMVPVENTLGGMVGQVNGLLLHSKLKVVGAVKLPVHHCLLMAPGTDYRNLRRVYSHPQALSQCREFLARQNLEPMRYYDTAGAARMISEELPSSSAAIASKLAASYYNLEIFKEEVEDLETNQTHFFVLAKEDAGDQGTHCSIRFSTNNKAGALFHVLELFAKSSINLTRIDSVPDQPGSFAFFLDFEGSLSHPEVQKTLKEVESKTGTYSFLGCYNEVSL